MIFIIAGAVTILALVFVLSILGNHYFNGKGSPTFILLGLLFILLAFLSHENGPLMYSVIGILSIVGAISGKIMYDKGCFDTILIKP